MVNINKQNTLSVLSVKTGQSLALNSNSKVDLELRPLFSEFINEKRYASKASKETLRGYQSTFDLFAKLMPDVGLTDLTSTNMTEFFSLIEKRVRIIGKGKTKRGVKISSIATYRSKLNTFFDWLTENGHIESSPFSKMKYPKVYYDDRQYLKKQDMEKIFLAISFNIKWANHFIECRNLAIFGLAFYCGLRKGELLGLKIHNIDIKRKQIEVSSQTSKSRRQRVVPINVKLLDILKTYLQERKKTAVSDAHLFISDNRKHEFTSFGLKHLMEKVKTASGVNFHIHQLRHTFAVNLLNNGTDIAKIKQLMGHQDIRMTATYLRCLPAKAMQMDLENLTLDNLI
jgi:site-specific recombinase XerD